MPRDSRIAASEAAAIPFPSEETTPPDTNTYLVIEKPGGGMRDDSRIPSAPQRADEKSRKNSRGSPSDDVGVFPTRSRAHRRRRFALREATSRRYCEAGHRTGGRIA